MRPTSVCLKSFRHCRWDRPMASAFWPGPWSGATDRWKLCHMSLWLPDIIAIFLIFNYISNPGFVIESESSWIIWNCIRDYKDHLKNAWRWNFLHARPLQQVCCLKPSVFRFFWTILVHRYSPAPISIKHLLEHGKTNDNLVRTIITGLKVMTWWYAQMIDEMLILLCNRSIS